MSFWMVVLAVLVAMMIWLAGQWLLLVLANAWSNRRSSRFPMGGGTAKQVERRWREAITSEDSDG